jgi:ATP-dependent RNA helicase DHX8/PRP22
VLTSEGLGDHALLLRLWQLWAAAGCSRDFCRDYGLDLRGMNFARDVRRQLEGARLPPGRSRADGDARALRKAPRPSFHIL